jgi:hypothetical protein
MASQPTAEGRADEGYALGQPEVVQDVIITIY